MHKKQVFTLVHFFIFGVVVRVVGKDYQVDGVLALMFVLKALEHAQNLRRGNRRVGGLEREESIGSFDGKVRV